MKTLPLLAALLAIPLITFAADEAPKVNLSGRETHAKAAAGRKDALEMKAQNLGTAPVSLAFEVFLFSRDAAGEPELFSAVRTSSQVAAKKTYEMTFPAKVGKGISAWYVRALYQGTTMIASDASDAQLKLVCDNAAKLEALQVGLRARNAAEFAAKRPAPIQ